MLASVQSFNSAGMTGIIAASVVMVLWMLPRFLDLVRLDASVDAITFLSFPVVVPMTVHPHVLD